MRIHIIISRSRGSAAIALLCLASAGCGPTIRFEARTTVASSGAVSRTTRFSAPDGRSRDEIEGRYALPAGGTWTTETRQVKGEDAAFDGRMDVYRSERQCPAGCQPESDHVRRALYSNAAARNEFRVTVRNYVLVKTFLYEERFRDIVTLDSFERGVRAAYGITVENVARALTDERGEGGAARTSALIRTGFDPLLDKYLSAFRRMGVRRFLVDKVLHDELNALFDDSSIVARVVAVVPPPPGEDADAWRKVVSDAVKQASDNVWYVVGPPEEDMFGAIGLQLFGSYDFAIDASLPGTVVESNATSREGDVLKWTFERDAFLVDDYVLRARSRIIYPQRIALTATSLVALFTAGWVVRRRTTPAEGS